MTAPDDPLAGLLAGDGVAAAVEAARTACEELRWHEAYRRRWREVRAEAGLRTASASAALDGARVPLEVVRGLATSTDGAFASAGPPSPVERAAPGGPEGAVPGGSERAAPGGSERAALGALRATAFVERLMPDLGARSTAVLPPFGQLLAGLHAAATAGLLAPGLVGRVRHDEVPTDLTGLGRAPRGDEVAARVDLLGHVVRSTRAPALVVAAVVHGELLAVRPFVAGNGVVARALARLLVTTRGLDPTGSVLAEAGWAQRPNLYLAAAAGFATGTPEGVAGWLRCSADAVVDGASRARTVADAVLAGRRVTLPGGAGG